MTQVNLQRFAASTGIKKNIKDMTQAELVRLRYNFVLEKTKNAQGDFARTADSTANSSRTLKESIKELGAQLSTYLLPIINPIIREIVKIVQEFSKLDAGTQRIIVYTLLAIAAISPIASIIHSISAAIGGLSTALIFLEAHPIVLLITAIVAGIFLLIKAIKYLWDTNEDFRNAVTNIWNGIKNVILTVCNTFISIFTEKIPNLFMSAISFITSLPGRAFKWGSDMIEGFVKGITSKIAAVVNAVKNIAKRIRNFLHFSCPDEGPLADYESWMPDFLDGLQKGIEDNKHKVIDSVRGLTTDVNTNLKINSSFGVDKVPTSTSNITNNSSGRNTYNITIDAKNVREFTDVVNMCKDIPQVDRQYA